MKKCKEDIEKKEGNFKLELDERGKVVDKFEKDIFKYLVEEDRQDVINELQESLDEGDGL